MWKIIVTLYDGEEVVAERLSESSAELFARTTRAWGIQHNKTLYAGGKIKEIKIVEASDPAGDTPQPTPSPTRRAPRKRRAKSNSTKD